MRRGLLLALAVALAACRAGESEGARTPIPVVRVGEVAWSYSVRVEPGAEWLAVDARFAAGTAEELTVTEGAEPFVRDVQVKVGGGWRAAPHDGAGTSWLVDACPSRGCEVRYRFALDDAAHGLWSDSTVRPIGSGAYEATPAAWLLHPLELPPGAYFEVHAAAQAPDVFATGLTRVAPDTYRAPVESIPFTPYTVMGRLRVREVTVPASGRGRSATLRVAIAPGKMRATDDELVAWLTHAAAAVRDYYGVYPIDAPLLVVLPHGRRSVGYGRTMAGGGASILIDVGPETDAAELADDWVAVHEMIHLAFPSVPRRSLWIEEGLATYLEPIVRARAGMMDPYAAWSEFARMMQNGLPEPGDQGLDRTHTWGRVYWGGALFCLVADVTLREKTGGVESLDDAVRGILYAGGNDAQRWETAQAFAVGDRATRTTVLSDLYAAWGNAPGTVDLDALWARLGVMSGTRDVVLDDDAPLAGTRRAIMYQTSGTAPSSDAP